MCLGYLIHEKNALFYSNLKITLKISPQQGTQQAQQGTLFFKLTALFQAGMKKEVFQGGNDGTQGSA